jgi:predicted PurR-regulated permease PerM
VCYTGYSIIGYSDEIRDGCFFETIKKRKCPAANMPNTGISDILKEFMKGMFSFSYIGVVTALSFFFFCIWFIYYFLKPFMVQFYNFIMSSTKSKVEAAKNVIVEAKKNVSETANKFKTQVSNTAENVSKSMVENQKASSELINKLNPISLFPNTGGPKLPEVVL